jgi:hypothetical protein
MFILKNKTKTVQFNRKELYNYLVKKKQIRDWNKTNKFFKREAEDDEYPIQCTKSGYFYAIIKGGEK